MWEVGCDEKCVFVILRDSVPEEVEGEQLLKRPQIENL